MDDTPISLPAAIRRLAQEERGKGDGDLPAPETLVAYRARKLAADAEEALEGHLALHPESVRELLDLASFPDLEAPSAEHRLSDRDVQDALAQIRDRLPDEDEPEAEDAQEPSPRRQPEGLDAIGDAPSSEAPTEALPGAVVRPFPPRGGSGLARHVVLLAAAVVAVAGAFLLGTFLDAPEVQPAAHYASVIDIAVTRGPRTYTVSEQAEQLLLVVQDAGLGPHARGEVVLSTEAGEVIHTFDLVAPADADSLLTLALPRDKLPAGSYRLELFGVDDAGRQPVKEFRLTLDPGR